MKKIIIYASLLISVPVLPLTMTSCEDIDEVPPRKDHSTGKSYKLPDPVVMDAADIADYESIKDEYDLSTSL